jgi:Ca2+-binding EF-hand superfamily protein
MPKSPFRGLGGEKSTMKRKTLIILAGLAVVVGGVVAVGAAGHRMHRFGGHFGGPMGMGGGMHLGGFGEHGGMRGERMGERLKALDANKDGAVSLDEFLAGRKPPFERLDANKDGVITSADLEANAKEMVDYWARVMIKRLDANKDGKVSRDEFGARAREGFSFRDLNSDGRIDGDDLPAGMRERWRRWAEHRGSGSGSGEEGAPGRGPGRGPFTLERLTGRMDTAFKRFDTNGDGFVDAAEITASAGERTKHRITMFMRRFDADKDGKVTSEEFNRFARERFAAFDLDDDGRISESDLPPMMRGRGVLK